MPSIAEQRARIAELASRMIAKNPGNAGAIMQQLKGAGLDISGNPLPPGPFQMPSVPPAGGLSYTGLMSGDQLGPLAKYAGRTPTAPPGPGLTPEDMAIPFGGTGGDPNSLRSMADRGDPSQASGFRSRLADARMMQGSGTPGQGLAIAGATPPTAQVSGQLPGNFMSPGNMPRPRPFESMLAARPEGPPSGFPAAAGPPSPMSMARPEGPPGGFPAATQFSGNLPRTRPPEQLAAAGPPSPMTGAGPPSPIIGRDVTPSPSLPPGLSGPPSPLASRFGDQSQLASSAFSGGRPPMPPSTMPGGETFAPPSALASRLGGQPPVPGGAFSGPPPPMAAGPTPQQLAAAKDQVQQIAALRPPSSQQPVPPTSSLMPIETTPTTIAPPNPLQRAPLDLAAGVGAPKLPLGSTSLPFAAIPPTPASVAQRTEMLGPLPPGAGTGVPVRSVQPPLISTPPSEQAIAINAPPASMSLLPPDALAAYMGKEEPIVGQDLPAPPPAAAGVPEITPPAGPPTPAITSQLPGYKAPDLSRISTKEAEKRARERGFGSLENSRRDRLGRIAGATAGATAGLFAGGPGGAVTLGTAGYKFGDNFARGIANLTRSLRGRGQKVDAQGNILDKAGNIIGHISNLPGNIASGIGNAFGNRGSSVSSGGGGGMGGWGGIGGWGGGGQGGSYGGYGGSRINEGIGGAYRNR